MSWLLLPFCQDLESFAHVLVAFFNICGCGKITDNLFEASKLVFSGRDFQEATWDRRLDRATRGNESLDVIFTWPINRLLGQMPPLGAIVRKADLTEK